MFYLEVRRRPGVVILMAASHWYSVVKVVHGRVLGPLFVGKARGGNRFTVTVAD